MFENVGEKIKGSAAFLLVLESAAAIIIGMSYLIEFGIEDAPWALFIMIFGPVVALVSSWLIYGFGELIVKSSANERNTRAIHVHLTANNKRPAAQVATPPKRVTHSWRCCKCGKMATQVPCEHCGNGEDASKKI